MFRLKPLGWRVVPWGLLAGGLLTLLLVFAKTNWQPLPSDCGEASSSPYGSYSLRGGCTTLEAGYPVTFLSTAPFIAADPSTSARDAGVSGQPVIEARGLTEDWLIWSLASYVVLYIFLPVRKTRGHLPDAGTPGLAQARPDAEAQH